jgi:hypothetical protein
MRSAFLVLLTSLLLLTPLAVAEPANLVRASAGYLYFNRPGATMALHDSELADCLGVTGFRFPTRSSPMIPMGIVGSAIENGIQNRMISGWQRAAANIQVELCMVVKGWRLLRLDDREGRRLSTLDQPALASELSTFVGSSSPPGEIIRTFRNDAALWETVQDRSPANASRVLLSEQALAPRPDPPVRSVEWRSELGTSILVAPVVLADIQSIPEGRALVLIAVHGRSSLRTNMILGVARDQGPQDLFQVDLRHAQSIGSGAVGQLEAFLVPAGRWRIVSARSNTNLCLGAPSFDASAGSVVFAGAFDLSAPVLAPDMTLNALQPYLQTWPSALPSPRPAQWVNGEVSPCPFTALGPDYALEFDGMPYRDGYVWGGAARVVH